MILGYDTRYPPDAIEAALPDARAARARWAAAGSDLPDRFARIASRIGADGRSLDAALLGATRLGLRHGSLGQDFHAYHNEAHALELAERRLTRTMEALGPALPGEDATALLLFAACHDLRPLSWC